MTEADLLQATVIGCDVSSYQLDFAIIDGDNARFERIDLGKGTLIERVRNASWSQMAHDFRSRMLFRQQGCPWLIIEEPYGPSQRGLRALWATVGALSASWPPEKTAWITPQDWRAEIGAKNTKDAGCEAVINWLVDSNQVPMPLLSEHEYDALGVALAWRSILSKQKEAA